MKVPENHMFMAGNKSGIASKKGLIFGAEIIDEPYLGE
jgi:dUTPase